MRLYDDIEQKKLIMDRARTYVHAYVQPELRMLAFRSAVIAALIDYRVHSGNHDSDVPHLHELPPEDFERAYMTIMQELETFAP